MEQRTEAWFAARSGKVTASKLAEVMAKVKTGDAATRKKYRAELICQRLTGKRGDTFVTLDMKHGTALEPVAREAYILREFAVEVTEVGLVDHPTIEGFAASPDGLVNEDGLIEIKCPKTWTHLKTIRTGVLEKNTSCKCTRKCCVRGVDGVTLSVMIIDCLTH